MANQELDKLFEQLDKRLTEIFSNNLGFDVCDDFPHYSFTYVDLGLIEKEIIKFGTDALNKIQFYLKQVSRAIERIPQLAATFDVYCSQAGWDSEVKEETKLREQGKFKIYLEKQLERYKTVLSSLESELMNTGISINEIEEQTDKTDLDNKHDKLLDTIRPLSGKVCLNIYQTALFFDYLKQERIILPYRPTPLSKIVSTLTSYSHNTIGSEEGFGVLDDIMCDKKVVKGTYKKRHCHNLNTVKEALQALILLVDRDIEKQPKQKTVTHL